MGPKSKGNKSKSDWSICNLTGIGFHTSDSAAHSSLLETSCSSPNQLDISFPHVYNSIFKTSISVNVDGKLGPLTNYSEKFNTIFLPNFVVQSCGIGFGTWVSVSGSSFHIVLRVFPHNIPDHKNGVCTRGSWLDQLNVEDELLQVEKFHHMVHYSTDIRVDTEPYSEEYSSLDFLRRVKSFLENKILSHGISVPFSYFGKKLNLILHLPVVGPEADCDESLNECLGNISLTDEDPVTSTPCKPRRETRRYFTVTSSTRVKLDKEPNQGNKKKTLTAGGVIKQKKILQDSVNSIFSSSRKGINGILLYGPPGVGKTLVALNLEDEIKANFKLIVGPELYSKFYGETETKIREVFEEAERLAPTVLVLDELDCLAPRKDGEGGDQEKRVVATLQSCLDKIQMQQIRDKARFYHVYCILYNGGLDKFKQHRFSFIINHFFFISKNYLLNAYRLV